MINNYINNRKNKKWGNLQKKAVQRLGGIEYQTIEHKNKILHEMEKIKEEKKEKRINFIHGFITGIITSLISTFLWYIFM